MIQSKKDLKFYLHEDRARSCMGGGKFGYILRLCLNNEQARAYRYIRCLRHFEFYSNSSHQNILVKLLKTFYRAKLMYLGGKYNIYITPNACGFGLRILHLSGGGGVHLNVKKVGNYCAFNAGVLIGNKDSQDNRCEIGDHTAFAPGSKAFGKLKIGSNVFVAPNAVVTKDVPDNCVVGGIPARIIKPREENNRSLMDD